MRPDDLTRIRHMFEAAENAQDFISGKSRADLDTDPMLLFALVRAIEIIGEAFGRRVQLCHRCRHFWRGGALRSEPTRIP